MDDSWIMTAVITGVSVLFVVYIALAYNSLVSRMIEATNIWSQINGQLQRRHELVLNLAEAIKGQVSQEQQSFDKVIQARNQSLAAKNIAAKAQAESQLTTAVRELLAVAKADPGLKTSQSCRTIQEQLATAEKQIGSSKQHYNAAIAKYNRSIQRFPVKTIAALFGFRPAEFFNFDPA